MIRWPGHIKPGSVANEIVSVTTGSDVPRRRRRSRCERQTPQGHGRRRQDLQGPRRRLQPASLSDRQVEKSPRRGFFYFNDDGDIVAVRVENWKIVFLEQRVPGTLAVWGEPFTPLRLPKMYDLHADPYEQADITSNTYYGWSWSRATSCSRQHA